MSEPIHDHAERKDWMMTFTGRRVFPLAVKPDDICIEDISHSLALLCRYNGHVSDFYSVAEHSMHISEALERDGHPPMTQLCAVLHDGSEAFLSDMIRPIKNSLGTAYDPFRNAHDRIDQMIAEKWGLPWPHAPVVKAYDMRIVNDEKRLLFGPYKPWDEGGAALDIKIHCYSPNEADRLFRFRFYSLLEACKR